jgi:2,4-dienoyl-CoA reductase-like NADH-dependent reductase (Old Yellow Enzyme family)
MVPVSDGGWEVLAPSSIAFDNDFPEPREMTAADIDKVVADFVNAAERSVKAGFEVVEIHAAHGYLLHEFLSPLSNRRTDQFGGSLENRMRFPLAIAAAVRNKVPESLPVFVRISATDWVEGGWDIEQSIEFCRRLKEIGIDLIDVSSGGNVPDAKIAIGPGYQVPFARDIRNGAEITTAAVGMITEPAQAEEILQKGEADAIFIAREFLREPSLPLRAAAELGGDVNVPRQYGRAIQVKRMRAADGR